jgi:hypothetical protein
LVPESSWFLVPDEGGRVFWHFLGSGILVEIG